MLDAPVSFAYAVRELPPGRFPFRRWRWELWHKELLLAAGWVMRPAQVERAVRTAASRRMHQVAGVTALRPETARLVGTLGAGRSARLETAVGVCLLVSVEAFETGAAAA